MTGCNEWERGLDVVVEGEAPPVQAGIAVALRRVRIGKRRERSRLDQPNSGGNLKLLLTSAGIKNASIHDALVELLGKPIAECDALCIPTALYGHPMAGPRQAWRCISGQEP